MSDHPPDIVYARMLRKIDTLSAQRDELLAALEATVAMIEDGLDGARGYGHDTKFVRGISDVEIKPDGSMRLSHARAAIAKAKEQQT